MDNEIESDANSNEFLVMQRNASGESLGNCVKKFKDLKSIELLPVEKELANICFSTSLYISEKLKCKPVLVRFAGGWVRDKLLGLICEDIDIAVEDMTGFKFATYLSEYIRISKRNNRKNARVVRIVANPDKSKHLETARMTLLNLSVDFANLRSEMYTNNSRIPQIEFGTPLQDASRRDATINALFYNIQTGQVEDYTGQGLDDLENKIIRTPIEPRITFLDDPLRVLRCLRFAAKFGFSIEQLTLETMSLPEVKDSFRKKVSLERVSVEFNKVLAGPDPERGLLLYAKIGFIENVLQQFPDESFKEYYPKFIELSGMLYNMCLPYGYEQTTFWLIVSMFPWFDQPLIQYNKQSMEHGRSKGLKSAAAQIMCVKLHLGCRAKSPLDVGVHFAALFNPANIMIGSRASIGALIRKVGPHWKYAILVNCLSRHINQRLVKVNDDLFDEMKRSICHIYDLGLEEAYALKPLLNGNEIRELGKIEEGFVIRECLDQLLRIQMENSEITKQEILEIIDSRSTDNLAEILYSI